jgi:transcriptional regulator with XRE-family HTH domain
MTVLEKLRKGSKFSRKKLSELSGISHVTIYKIEKKGYTAYSRTTMKKIAKALDVPESFFL